MAPSPSPEDTTLAQQIFRTPSILTGARKASNASVRESSAIAQAAGEPGGIASPGQRVAYTEPERPSLPARLAAGLRGESHRSMNEAMRLARSREEQETLLNDEEQADDDGCYPPRKNDDPRAPNPHGRLPVYTTIHKIRRLVVASIGRSLPRTFLPRPCARSIAFSLLFWPRNERSLRFFNRTARASC